MTRLETGLAERPQQTGSGPGVGPGVGAITRRAAIGLLAAAGLGYAVLYRPRPDPAARGRTIVDYWEKWTGHEASAMQAVVDEFNGTIGAEKNIFVRYFTMSGIDQKSMVAIAGGDPPDLIGLWNHALPLFGETGAIQPLDGFVDEWGLDSRAYAPRVWDLCRHAGRTWGLPSTTSTIAFYYNRGLFREAKSAGLPVDPDRPPRTIEELDRVADALTVVEGEGASRRVVRSGFLPTEPGWWPFIWGHMFGGKLYDERTDRATAAAPENVRAYRWVRTYPEKWGPGRLSTFQSGFGNYFSQEQPLLMGRVASSLHGSFLSNVINRFRPEFDYAAVPLPMDGPLVDDAEPVGMIEADMLVVPSGAKHPREAFEFVAYTQRRDVQRRLASAHGKSLPFRRLAEDEQFIAEHPNRMIRVHEAIANSERAFAKPRTRLWPEYRAEFQAGFDRIWRLTEPPERVLEGIERRMQAALDRAAENRRRRGLPPLEGRA